MRIVFTGDIAFSERMRDGWRAPGCVSDPVAAYLRAADHVIANVESPLTAREIRSSRALNHISDPAAGAYLSGLNLKNWSLANNHITDCGADGLQDTLRAAEMNGCRTFGAGMNLADAAQPLVLGDQIKVGLIAVARPWAHLRSGASGVAVFTWDQETLIRQQLSELRRQADYVVVIAHGEDEYNNMPMPYTRERYHRLLRWGADLVVAHHPHVVQNFELAGEKAIFYSLGNFIFDTDNQHLYDHTESGILLGVEFTKTGMQFDHLAIRTDRDSHAVLPGETPAIFRDIPADEYQRLWPLEAARFYPIDRDKRRIVQKRLASMSPLRFFLHELRTLLKKRARTILLGRILSCFGRWKRSRLSEVVTYLRG